GGVLSYLYDRESADFSRPVFVELLRLLQIKTGLTAIHVIAHSMGNQVVTAGLAALGGNALVKPLAELILAAPDVDVDNFKEHVPIIRGMTRGITLYASSADKALVASKLCAKFPRAGDVPVHGPVILPELETIDVTSVGNELFGLNHNVFAATRSLID